MAQAMQSTTSTVVRLPRSATKKTTRKAPRVVRKLRHQAAAGVVIIGVAMVLIGLSLAHLAAGVALVTHASTVESWAMAIGIDIAFVSLEGAIILIANEK